jgi:hypothetical protein
VNWCSYDEFASNEGRASPLIGRQPHHSAGDFLRRCHL